MEKIYINTLANNYVNKYTNEAGEVISDLISYSSTVARYNHATNKMRVFGWYSRTTAKHINDFLEYYGFDRVTKKELESYWIKQ